jgi:hypothetical protein
VHILKKKRINYIYIFEVNPLNQVTHFQIYTIALILMVVYFISCAVQDV